MTYDDLHYLWGANNCKLWGIWLDNGQEMTDYNQSSLDRFVSGFHQVRRGWLFLEYFDGDGDMYIKVYRIDGSFLWEFK